MRLDHLLSKEKEGIERLPEFEIEKKRAREIRGDVVVRFSRTKGPRNGGVAQLGEHLPCKQGVKGSIPFISTTVRTERTNKDACRKGKWAHSSEG